MTYWFPHPTIIAHQNPNWIQKLTAIDTHKHSSIADGDTFLMLLSHRLKINLVNHTFEQATQIISDIFPEKLIELLQIDALINYHRQSRNIPWQSAIAEGLVLANRQLLNILEQSLTLTFPLVTFPQSPQAQIILNNDSFEEWLETFLGCCQVKV